MNENGTFKPAWYSSLCRKKHLSGDVLKIFVSSIACRETGCAYKENTKDIDALCTDVAQVTHRCPGGWRRTVQTEACEGMNP